MRTEPAIIQLKYTIQKRDTRLRPSTQTFFKLLGVSIGPEKSIHLTALVDPPIDEQNSTDKPSAHITPPDSRAVSAYNEDDIVDMNLDVWLVIDTTGTTTKINELLPPADGNDNLLDCLIDQNMV